MNLRRALIAGAIGAGAAIVLASAAWACAIIVPPAVVTIEDPVPAKALAGTRATVQGKNFLPGPVALAWGTNADQASKIADVSAATDGTFTGQVTIPDMAPGNYYVFGLGPTGQGKPTYEPAPFEVLAPDAGPPDAGPPPNYVNSNSADAGSLFAAEDPSPVGGPATGPSETTSGSVTGPTGVPLPGSGAVPAATFGALPAATFGAVPPAAPAAVPGLTRATSESRPGLADSPQGLLAGQPSLTDSSTAALGALSPDSPAVPSSRSFARDLWSGFTGGSGPTQVPSLLDVPPPSSHAPGLLLGLGLAFGATLALCTGFGLAEVRRRRALA